MQDCFKESHPHLPSSLIDIILTYRRHSLPNQDLCAMMCLFEEDQCQFYISTNNGKGDNCFLGKFDKIYSRQRNRSILSTLNNVTKHFRRDQAEVNITEGVLKAFDLADRYSIQTKLGYGYGSCNGTGIYVVEPQINWTVDFDLAYSKWYSRCVFVIIKASIGRIKMTIPNFNVSAILFNIYFTHRCMFNFRALKTRMSSRSTPELPN